MRPWIAVTALLVLLVSGCAEPAATRSEPAPARKVVGRGTGIADAAGPYTTDLLEYEAPNATGAWAVAFWIRTEVQRICDFRIGGVGKPGGGTWDSVGVVAKSWKRPEVLGGVEHGFNRGDGYVGHAGSSGQAQSLKQQAPVQRDTMAFEHRRRVDLPPEAFLMVGNSYMAPPQPGRVGLRLALDCDGPFTVHHAAETSRMQVVGPEDFDGLLVADTIAGFGAQRGASKSLPAQDGFVVLLHEDGNQGNAEYTTTRPDGSSQTDTFGNRIVVGGPGVWRFGLNRVSPSPGGEFRLFAMDLAVPALDGSSAPVQARP